MVAASADGPIRAASRHQHFANHGIVDLLRFRIPNAAPAHAQTRQGSPLRGQCILAQDAQRSVVALAGETDFDFTAPGIAGPPIGHFLVKLFEFLSAQIAQPRQRRAPLFGGLLDIGVDIFGAALYA